MSLASMRNRGESRVLRPALSPKSDNIQPTAKPPYEADCFTPKRTLKRTPPKKTPVTSSNSTTKTEHHSSPKANRNTRYTSEIEAHCQENKSPLVSSNASSNHEASNCTATSTPKRDTTKHTHARRSLHSSGKHAGGTKSKEPGSKHSGTTTPRGRETIVDKDLNQSVSLQEKKVQAPCFTPSHSLKRSPPSSPMNSPQLDFASDDKEDLIDAAPPQTHWELPRTPQCSPVHIHQVQVDPLRSTRKTPSVHPLSHSTRATPPEPTQSKSAFPPDGMTEDDLAFLQEMKYARQQKDLQDKCTQLEKALKTTAQQKELLQHEALKIGRDIEDKRSKYQETLDSVHTLISSSSFNSKDSATARTNNVEREGLTGGHIAQLRKMNQLASAQLEKTGHELKGRLLEVGRKKKELEHQVRVCEEQQKDKLSEMESKTQSMQVERKELEKTMKKTSEEHATMQAQIQELQSTLEMLSIEKMEERESQPRSLSQLEKQKAEKRLQRIIRRCELYVKRHEMLKEMGIR